MRRAWSSLIGNAFRRIRPSAASGAVRKNLGCSRLFQWTGSSILSCGVATAAGVFSVAELQDTDEAVKPLLRPDQVNQLIKVAAQAKENAYAPYSDQAVGVALLGKNGKVYKGSKVENASYGLTICAEQAAIFSAVADGTREFAAVVISTDFDKHTWCCGSCCSVIREFGADTLVYSVNSRGEVEQLTIAEMTPYAFVPDDLYLPRLND